MFICLSLELHDLHHTTGYFDTFCKTWTKSKSKWLSPIQTWQGFAKHALLHCRVQLMNSQREEDDDINQKLSKSQQAARLTAAMNGKRSSSLWLLPCTTYTTPFSCRLSKDQQHAKKIADSKLLTTKPTAMCSTKVTFLFTKVCKKRQ